MERSVQEAQGNFLECRTFQVFSKSRLICLRASSLQGKSASFGRLTKFHLRKRCRSELERIAIWMVMCSDQWNSFCQDPDAPTTPSDTIDRLTTPSSLLWHPRRCYGRSPFVIHFLQVYNPTMSVIQFFLAKLYGTRRGNNWHEGFQYKANGKTKLWSSESRGNKQI